MEKTDSELVALARAGHEEAFSQLVDRHQARAERVARGMVRGEDAAQELVQEAMLQAYLSLDHLRDGARFASWLHGIVRNLCRHHLRDREAECLSWESIDGDTWATPTALDPGEIVQQREQERLVLDAVYALSPANRETTLLFYFEQRSVQEIAGALGVSVGAVKGRLHQSRKQLKERLRPLYPEAADATSKEMRNDMVPVNLFYLPQSTPGCPTASEEAARQYLMQFITATASWRDWAYLVEDGGSRFLPLLLGRDAHVIVALLEGAAAVGAPTASLVSSLLKATHTQVEQVRLEPLNAETLHGVVRLRCREKVVEIAARPGEALALAAQMQAPIAVADAVMAAASWDLSDPVATVARVLDAGDVASLRRAAESPIVGRIAQAFLERGMRHISEESGQRAVEVVLETRQSHGWAAVWLLWNGPQGSSSGGNISLPLDALPVLIAHFKLMAGLDLVMRGVRQQGHTTVQHRGRAYDLQVSTEAAGLGERLRLWLQG